MLQKRRENMEKIKLNFDSYRDKVRACFIGKNIGGTMGWPYEGKRETFDIKGYSTPPGKPLPNDDLDLQLVWLHAVETCGLRALSADALGAYWLDLIVPNWNEYGIGKSNMRRGLVPPFSGEYENSWKNSNGAWIRTEIWACLAPACPAIAAKYAIEDAKVDHGAAEGTVAAAFVAAMQAAAFAVKDIRAAVELALSAIPEQSRMADSIRFLLDCFDRGMDPIDARNAVQKRNADIGDGWFEAPSNVAYAVIGLLWGRGDFKKALITAINCGDDADCTGATVGATMGIFLGTAGVPEDWSAYIGDEIVTISLNKTCGSTGLRFPKTCTELCERVVAEAPHALHDTAAPVCFTDGESEVGAEALEKLCAQCAEVRRAVAPKPYTAHYESTVLLADLTLSHAPEITAGGEIGLSLEIYTRRTYGDILSDLTFRWWLPQGFTVEGKRTAMIPNRNSHDDGIARASFTLRAGDTVLPENRIVLEISIVGRPSLLYIPIVLLG
jgi:hypothetical protein